MTYHTTEELIGGRSEWAVSPNNFNGLIDSHILANQRISELEAQLDSVRALLAAEMQAVEKLGESRDNLNAALQVAREALEIAEKEIRIAAVMLSQVEPSAAVTVKESDRLHLASDKMCVVSDLSRKALARIEEAVCGSK